MNAALILLALAVQDERHPWQGFAEGSWVEVRTTVNKDVTTKKQTVTKVEGDIISLSVDTTKGGKTETLAEDVFTKVTPQEYPGAEKGKKAVTIDGRKFEGIVLVDDGQMKATRTICKGVPTPGGLVFEEWSYTNAKATSKRTFKLERVAEKRKIGDKTVTCWMTSTVADEAGKLVNEKAWYSHDVPGHVVRIERNITDHGTARTVLIEALKFEAKTK